jgi:transcriptional regulator with XRE-family HTH domain
MNEVLKSELRRRMKAAKLTQKQLSLAAGLGETAVSDIFNDKSRNPTARVLTALATQLGCGLADLTGPSPQRAGSATAVAETTLTPARRLCQLVSARFYDAYENDDVKSAAIEDYSTFLLPEALDLLRQGKSEPEVLHALIQRSRQKAS